MEVLGQVTLRDSASPPLLLLPGGFWAAAAVWLEKPQVVNKRLCGACLEETQRVARPRPRPRPRPGGSSSSSSSSSSRASVLQAAWEAFGRCPDCQPLLSPGPPEEELQLLLRTLVPKGGPLAPAAAAAAAAREMVVKDTFNSTITFLPLKQCQEGKCKINKCNAYQIRFQHVKGNEWSLSILSSSPENYISDGIVYPKTAWLGSELLSKLAKWSLETKKPEFKSTLSLISVARYSRIYQVLKEKYKEIVKVWPEVTDPEKFVYEDVAIAAYLLILWEDERIEKGLSRNQTFMDLGCGNGLLVHILSNEGHPGKGLDVRRRKIWDTFGPQTHLEERAVSPNDLYPDVDWLIGNHSDELTPWIPVIAARSSYSCRYFVLPCCFFDFHGKFNRRQSKKTQYREYLDFITEVGFVCGFNVEEDCLRIPSTKRVGLIGKSRRYLATQHAVLEEQRAHYINSHHRYGKAAPDPMTGLDQNDNAPPASDATAEPQKAEVGRALIAAFQPRGKEQVRNCTALPHAFVDKVVLKVASLLLRDVQEDPWRNSQTWSRGESLALGEIAAHLDKDVLKTLRNECGGLQTLLRNNHQVFEVLNGRVHIRDWRERKPQVTSKPGTRVKQSLSSQAFKTRLCWFYIHHPHGCPLTSEDCLYAHGREELRPSQTVPKKNHARH